MTPPIAVPTGPRPTSEAPDANAQGANPSTDSAAVAAHSSESVRDSGAGWFYWIAALSLLNTILILFNSTHTMSLGLGATIAVDFIGKGAAESVRSSVAVAVIRVVELVLDALILGFFVLCGTKAKRGKSWAFVAGGVVLLLDMLLVLAFHLWISAALHLWALISIYAGWNANKKLLQAQSQQATTDGSPWAP